MIQRTLTPFLLKAARRFPAIAVTGPRQSGKTTLTKALFPEKPYVSLENLDVRNLAVQDPRGFLSRYPKGAIFDEIQQAPELFSYLQNLIDENNQAGQFILTGSQHFLLLHKISQTLAGRVRIFHLLPFSLQELAGTKNFPKSPEDWIFSGMYPRVHDRQIPPQEWYGDYTSTYLERDIRTLENIGNLSTFHRFLKFCAARTGQLLNFSSLANDCGISHNTARSWISLLETSFIVHLLEPHHKNFNKRLVKAPKLYFYDTGLACSLLGIQNKGQLQTHPLRGALFETAALSELIKGCYHRGLASLLYFWRDKTGHEIDALIEKSSTLIPVEIKSSKTLTADLWKNLDYWKKLTAFKKSFLIYAGKDSFQKNQITALGWENLDPLRKILAL